MGACGPRSAPSGSLEGARSRQSVFEPFSAAKVPFQYEVYSGTAHGFSDPKNKAEERANAESIATTGRTLKELFGA